MWAGVVALAGAGGAAAAAVRRDGGCVVEGGDAAGARVSGVPAAHTGGDLNPGRDAPLGSPLAAPLGHTHPGRSPARQRGGGGEGGCADAPAAEAAPGTAAAALVAQDAPRRPDSTAEPGEAAQPAAADTCALPRLERPGSFITDASDGASDASGQGMGSRGLAGGACDSPARLEPPMSPASGAHAGQCSAGAAVPPEPGPASGLTMPPAEASMPAGPDLMETGGAAAAGPADQGECASTPRGDPGGSQRKRAAGWPAVIPAEVNAAGAGVPSSAAAAAAEPGAATAEEAAAAGSAGRGASGGRGRRRRAGRRRLLGGLAAWAWHRVRGLARPGQPATAPAASATSPPGAPAAAGPAAGTDGQAGQLLRATERASAGRATGDQSGNALLALGAAPHLPPGGADCAAAPGADFAAASRQLLEALQSGAGACPQSPARGVAAGPHAGARGGAAGQLGTAGGAAVKRRASRWSEPRAPQAGGGDDGAAAGPHAGGLSGSPSWSPASLAPLASASADGAQGVPDEARAPGDLWCRPGLRFAEAAASGGGLHGGTPRSSPELEQGSLRAARAAAASPRSRGRSPLERGAGHRPADGEDGRALDSSVRAGTPSDSEAWGSALARRMRRLGGSGLSGGSGQEPALLRAADGSHSNADTARGRGASPDAHGGGRFCADLMAARVIRSRSRGRSRGRGRSRSRSRGRRHHRSRSRSRGGRRGHHHPRHHSDSHRRHHGRRRRHHRASPSGSERRCATTASGGGPQGGGFVSCAARSGRSASRGRSFACSGRGGARGASSSPGAAGARRRSPSAPAQGGRAEGARRDPAVPWAAPPSPRAVSAASADSSPPPPTEWLLLGQPGPGLAPLQAAMRTWQFPFDFSVLPRRLAAGARPTAAPAARARPGRAAAQSAAPPGALPAASPEAGQAHLDARSRMPAELAAGRASPPLDGDHQRPPSAPGPPAAGRMEGARETAPALLPYALPSLQGRSGSPGRAPAASEPDPAPLAGASLAFQPSGQRRAADAGSGREGAEGLRALLGSRDGGAGAPCASGGASGGASGAARCLPDLEAMWRASENLLKQCGEGWASGGAPAAGGAGRAAAGARRMPDTEELRAADHGRMQRRAWCAHALDPSDTCVHVAHVTLMHAMQRQARLN